MRPFDESGCLVVAEVAQAHDGSLGTAHAYIDAAAEAGADAVKFQTHIADAESSPAEPWRVAFSRQDTSRHGYWKRMEFSEPQWRGLAEHARERGLRFLSTPFSIEAAELLESTGVTAWKIGSGDTGHLPLLSWVAGTGKPVLLSSGMANWAELDAAVTVVRGGGAPIAVLQCTTAYPCPPEKLGLNVIGELRERYGCPVGLSDHSGNVFGSLAAVALGALVVEVHVVFDRRCFGPDVAASVTVDELASLVRGVRGIEVSLAHPVDKDALADELGELRRTFGRSISSARDLPAGARIKPRDLAYRKPATGIPSSDWERVIGRRLRRQVGAGHFFEKDDFE